MMAAPPGSSPGIPISPGAFDDLVAGLCTLDGDLAGVVDRHGIPPFWHRPAGFATLVLFILEQQVSLASGKAVFDRIRAHIGEVTPGNLSCLTREGLGELGVTRQKSRYILELAAGVLSGAVDLPALEHLSDEDVRARLVSLVGIGDWTAEVYLLSALRRPDTWPVGDRALQVGTGEVLALPNTPTPAELAAIGDRWRPWRGVAARLVWHDYLSRRGRVETEVEGL